MLRKKEREKRRSTLRGLKAAQAASMATPKPKPKLRLDHRNYGAWYLNPEDWEKRFHRKSKKLALEQCLQKRESRHPEAVSGTKTKEVKATSTKSGVEKVDALKEAPPTTETPEIDDEEIAEVRLQLLYVCIHFLILLCVL